MSAEGLVRLFDGEHPATGQQLGRRLRRDGVAAWDVTFSADKSVSLLWALGDQQTQQQVLEAFEEAITEAFGYLESVASATRGASKTPVLDDDGNPVRNDDGSPRFKVETWPIETSGYVAASFTEFTSRADDPQLHTHVVIANKVRGEDGRWRTIDGRLLFRFQLAAGYLHEAVLRRELTRRLGVRWQPVCNGMADIDGFTRRHIDVFSRRRLESETWRRERGLPDTPAARQAAVLATRKPKQDHRLELYRQHQRLVTGRRDDVIAKAVDDWHRLVTATGDLTDGLLIAYHNDTVAELNAHVHGRLAASGRLHGPTLEIDQQDFQAGDRIVCRQNRNRLDVLNGDLGTVLSVDPDHATLTVRLDRDPEPRELPGWYLYQGHVDHGYALTGHKAQGVTTGHTLTVTNHDAIREWVYVAMSRGRQTNTLYLAGPEPSDEQCAHLTPPEPGDAYDALITSLSRSRTQRAAIDHPTGPGMPNSDDADRVDAFVAKLRAERDTQRRRPPDIGLAVRR